MLLECDVFACTQHILAGGGGGFELDLFSVTGLWSDTGERSCPDTAGRFRCKGDIEHRISGINRFSFSREKQTTTPPSTGFISQSQWNNVYMKKCEWRSKKHVSCLPGSSFFSFKLNPKCTDFNTSAISHKNKIKTIHICYFYSLTAYSVAMENYNYILCCQCLVRRGDITRLERLLSRVVPTALNIWR